MASRRDRQEDHRARRAAATREIRARYRDVVGGGHGRRDLHYVSGAMRVHVPDLDRHPSVVVASEPLDDTAGWRPLESGELVRVGRDLSVRSSIVVDRRPAQLIRRSHSTGEPMSLGHPRASVIEPCPPQTNN